MRKKLVCAICVLVVGNVVAADWDIDIVQGTVNKKALSTLTVESVTDTFGRPTDSYEYPPRGVGKKIEQTVLVYADSGVEFMFNSGGSIVVKVFLVDTRDGYGSYTQNYSHYKGKLTRDLNSDWKLKKFVEIFKEFDLVKQSDLGVACVKGSKAWIQIGFSTASGFINTLSISSGGKISDFCGGREHDAD
jgi:hypothetical protein